MEKYFTKNCAKTDHVSILENTAVVSNSQTLAIGAMVPLQSLLTDAIFCGFYLLARARDKSFPTPSSL
jgi:hypothetical protein